MIICLFFRMSRSLHIRFDNINVDGFEIIDACLPLFESITQDVKKVDEGKKKKIKAYYKQLQTSFNKVCKGNNIISLNSVFEYFEGENIPITLYEKHHYAQCERLGVAKAYKDSLHPTIQLVMMHDKMIDAKNRNASLLDFFLMTHMYLYKIRCKLIHNKRIRTLERIFLRCVGVSYLLQHDSRFYQALIFFRDQLYENTFFQNVFEDFGDIPKDFNVHMFDEFNKNWIEDVIDTNNRLKIRLQKSNLHEMTAIDVTCEDSISLQHETFTDTIPTVVMAPLQHTDTTQTLERQRPYRRRNRKQNTPIETLQQDVVPDSSSEDDETMDKERK